jgi:hypothetical protein
LVRSLSRIVVVIASRLVSRLPKIQDSRTDAVHSLVAICTHDAIARRATGGFIGILKRIVATVLLLRLLACLS